MAIKPDTLYPGRVAPADANYPFGGGRNETVDGADDGTPLEITSLADLWGFCQKLLTEAGITPSGDADTVVASQYFEAIFESGLVGPDALAIDLPFSVIKTGELNYTEGTTMRMLQAPVDGLRFEGGTSGSWANREAKHYYKGVNIKYTAPSWNTEVILDELGLKLDGNPTTSLARGALSAIVGVDGTPSLDMSDLPNGNFSGHFSNLDAYRLELRGGSDFVEIKCDVSKEGVRFWGADDPTVDQDIAYRTACVQGFSGTINWFDWTDNGTHLGYYCNNDIITEIPYSTAARDGVVSGTMQFLSVGGSYKNVPLLLGGVLNSGGFLAFDGCRFGAPDSTHYEPTTNQADAKVYLTYNGNTLQT